MRSKTSKVSLFIPLALVFFLLAPQNLVCDEQASHEYKLNNEFLKRFGSDIYEVIKAPAGWEKKDFWRLTAVFGTGALLFAFDQDIDDWSQDRRTSTSEDLARFGSALGDGSFLGAMIAAVYVTGEIFDKRGLRKTALLSLESWLTSGAFVLGMKALTGRARPNKDEGPYSFHPFTFRPEYSSFPSGHSSSAFAVAAVIADQSDSVVIDVLAFSLSTFAALSRIHKGSHWASDVFIGAAVGYFIGKKIAVSHREKDVKNVQIGFCLSPRVKGLTVSFSF